MGLLCSPIEDSFPTGNSLHSAGAVSIRNLDEKVRDRLRRRAAEHGRSMEAEMRAILVAAVREPGDDQSLLGALTNRFSELGGIDLDLAGRHETPRATDFTA